MEPLLLRWVILTGGGREGEIYVHLEFYTSDFAHRMYELFEGISYVELLGISWDVVEV